MKIKANGIYINYELSGQNGANTVMLSHSLGSDLTMWSAQMEPLENIFRVLRFDTRGHGKSDAPQGKYTLEQLGDDAVALMDALGIEKAHWVGISMGGMIGQSIALNHPDRLMSLVLCDTAAIVSEEDQPVWQDRIDTARNKGLEPLLQGTLERWFTAPFLSQNPPAVEQIREQYLATPVSGFIGCSEAIRRLNYIDRLHEIHMPTLIMVGKEDLGTPVTLSRAMHERISNSRLVVIPSAAHLSNVEQPEAFTAALIDFLEELK